MYSSLKNISALVFIIAGTIFAGTQLNSYIKYQQDKEAKAIIIYSIAQECKAVRDNSKMAPSFYSSSMSLNKILGKGIDTLDENTYLTLVSLCYGESKAKDKI